MEFESDGALGHNLLELLLIETNVAEHMDGQTNGRKDGQSDYYGAPTCNRGL